MQRVFFRTGILTLASALMVTTVDVRPASALFGGGGTGVIPVIREQHSRTRNHVSQEHDQTREQVVNAIEQQTTDLSDHLDLKFDILIEALRGQARENSNYQQMQVEAAQRVEDAAQVNETNRLKDEFRAKAESGEFDPNPFSCMMIDMFASDGGGGGGGATSGSDVARSTAAWAAGEHPAVQAGGAQMSRHVVEKAQEYEGYGGSPDATSDFGLLLDDPTIDFDDPEMAEVAGLIMNNLIDSQPKRNVSEKELATPAGIDRQAKIQEQRTRKSASIKSIEMAMNMRDNVLAGSGVESFRTMAKDSAYNRGTDFEDLSELQQIDIMTVWNYAPQGERLKALTGSHEDPGKNINSEKAWLYEIHRIMSLNTRIAYLQLELMNRDAIVNAGILATLNDD